MIPSGAREIVEARKRGLKPADLVIVSLIGKLNEQNPIVYANPEAAYDWGWARGLKFCIFIRNGVPWEDTALAIAKAGLDWLAIWDIDRFEGANVYALPTLESINRPPSRWEWRLDFLPWLKFQNEEFAWS